MIGCWISVGGNVRRTRIRLMPWPGLAAPGDGGHDRYDVRLLDDGLLALEKADVFLVHVDVDEPAQLPALVHEAVPQAGELALEVGHDAVDRLAGRLHLGVALGHLSQRRRNADRRHVAAPFSSSAISDSPTPGRTPTARA